MCRVMKKILLLGMMGMLLCFVACDNDTKQLQTMEKKTQTAAEETQTAQTEERTVETITAAEETQAAQTEERTVETVTAAEETQAAQTEERTVETVTAAEETQAAQTEERTVETVTAEASTDAVQPDEDTDEDTGYLQVPRRNVLRSEQKNIGFAADLDALALLLPANRSLHVNADGAYIIMRGDMEIGTVVSGVEPLDAQQVSLKQQSLTTEANVAIHYDLLADTTVTELNQRYFHRYVFIYDTGGTTRSITMTVKYSELNDAALEKINTHTGLIACYSDPNMGVLTLDRTKHGKPILILGNSFIGTSGVGDILQEMLDEGNQNAHRAVAVSRGYADVANSWGDFLSPIENGDYAAVFMCGFYGQDDVAALQQYKDACELSNTPLVIFPAHNESYGGVAAGEYADLLYLNWKGEIDRLIAEGIPLSDFCINDAHKHSTPLAGYVGAHMIYRAIYGCAPVTDLYQNLAAQLGSYAQTGRTHNIIKDLYYFNAIE